MNKLFIATMLSSLFALSACSFSTGSGQPDQVAGLTAVKHQSLDQLSLRPGTDFGRYRKILIEPITVTYSKKRRDIRPYHDPSSFEFDQRQLAIFNRQYIKAFSESWSNRFGWHQTDRPADDVIIVKAAVTDLYLNAPINNNQILPHKSFTNESSRMVIELTLVDSLSGDILLHSKGKKTTGRQGSGVETMRSMVSVTYWNDVHRAFRQWASLLGSQLSR